MDIHEIKQVILGDDEFSKDDRVILKQVLDIIDAHPKFIPSITSYAMTLIQKSHSDKQRTRDMQQYTLIAKLAQWRNAPSTLVEIDRVTLRKAFEEVYPKHTADTHYMKFFS